MKNRARWALANCQIKVPLSLRDDQPSVGARGVRRRRGRSASPEPGVSPGSPQPNPLSEGEGDRSRTPSSNLKPSSLLSKKTCLAWLVLIAAAAPAFGQKWAAEMFNNQTSYDFGVIARGAKAEHRFKIENIYVEDAAHQVGEVQLRLHDAER